MRKRRICYVAALGLALAVAIPGSAMGQDVQNIDAGFSSQGNANVVFGQTTGLSGKPSKNGTVRIATYLSGAGPPPSLQTVDVHLPEELTLDGKGLPQCNPAAITGQPPDAARAACSKSLVGTGFATALGISAPGTSLLFNGTPVGGNPSLLVYIFTANVPIVLPGQIRNSPLGSPYGQVIHVPVSTSAGGGVPPGIVVLRNEFVRISKTFKDPKVKKQIRRAKKQGNKKKVRQLKKKLNKTFASGSGCTDGTLSYRADFIHAPPDPVQSPTFEQPCTS
jgi:hypothetical protein